MIAGAGVADSVTRGGVSGCNGFVSALEEAECTICGTLKSQSDEGEEDEGVSKEDGDTVEYGGFAGGSLEGKDVGMPFEELEESLLWLKDS